MLTETPTVRRQYQPPVLRVLMLRETPATWRLALACAQRPPDELTQAAFRLVVLANRYNGMIAGVVVPQEGDPCGGDFGGLPCGGLRAKRATLECLAKRAFRELLLSGRAACLEVVGEALDELTGADNKLEEATV